MTALSTNDKLKLRLSAKRVEAWKRFRLTPHKNGTQEKPMRCKGIVFSPGQDKPSESLTGDKLEVVERMTDGAKFREVDIVPLRNGDNFSDYGHDAPKPAPIGCSERAKRLNSAYIYNAHRGIAIAPSREGKSPFKRRGEAMKDVIVVKGKL